MSWWMPLALLAIHRFIATTRILYAVLAALLTTAQLSLVDVSGRVLSLVCGRDGRSLVLVSSPSRPEGACGCSRRGDRGCSCWPLPCTRPIRRLAFTIGRLKKSSASAPHCPTTSDRNGRSALWAGRPLPDPQAERGLFPGAVVLVLAAIALWPPLGKARLPYAAALLVITEITRGSNGFLYPILYEWLAFMRGMRVPARASLLVGMALRDPGGLRCQPSSAAGSPALARGGRVRADCADRSRPLSGTSARGGLAPSALDLSGAAPDEETWCSPSFRWASVPVRPSRTCRTCTFPCGMAPI